MNENVENDVTLISSDKIAFGKVELVDMIENKKFASLKNELIKLPAADIAELFYETDEKYHAIVYRLLPKESAAEAFVEMDAELQEQIINSFTDVELSAMLDELYIDDTVDIIEEMPATVVKRIIRNSSKENRGIINRLLKYPKDSAGTIMTTEYVRFTKEMTVEEALSHIRHVAIDKETIYTCYITDDRRHLIGIITAKELLIADLKTKLSDIMEDSVVFVNTTDDREDVARKFDRYGFLALPVVDAECRLVGIVTVDDAISVLKEETEEDFAKMAAITPSEKSYLKTSAGSLWKNRIPWLMLLMISATLSSTILNKFEAVLPAILLIFVPMLMDTGGNCGSQASVTVIRALSVGEAKISDLPRILWKELRVGIMCGVTLGAVAFLKVVLIDKLLMQNPEITLSVAFSVSAAVALTIIAAKIIGSTLPLIAKKIGFDPAVMASPFITTLVDAIALVMYFLVSTLLIT
jgi:magnesium transporter